MMGRLKSDQGQLFYEFHLSEAVPRSESVTVRIPGKGRQANQKRTSSACPGMSEKCRFCCKSQLRQAANRDSVTLTRISARSIHDGPFEE